MFEPLKQTIDLLKSYDHEMNEEVHQQLQVCYHMVYVHRTQVAHKLSPQDCTNRNGMLRKMMNRDKHSFTISFLTVSDYHLFKHNPSPSVGAA